MAYWATNPKYVLFQLMKFFYLLGVRGYAFLIRVASLWNVKAKKWIEGRRVVWDALDNWKREDHQPVYWFHCASLGEFEQGRPLMEALKEKVKCQIVITFFSPSGYEIRKNYEGADLVIYLPRETRSNVKRFLKIVRPTTVFFIKYEFWATYIFKAKAIGAAVYSVSAVFHENQVFFKRYGGFMRKILRTFDHIFVQDQKSADLLNGIGVEHTLAGDTRYDRVMENAAKVIAYPLIEQFVSGEKVLVIGSSWPGDEAVIFDYLKTDHFKWKVIIAPHEIDATHLLSIEKEVGLSSIRYSNLTAGALQGERVLIIDNIGMLMNVYQYANVAFVGGAFGKGLHNILEPACFGVPVIFGSNYAKFNEAYEFIAHQIGFSISNTAEFAAVFQELEWVDRSGEVIKFMRERIGATQMILDHIKA